MAYELSEFKKKLYAALGPEQCTSTEMIGEELIQRVQHMTEMSERDSEVINSRQQRSSSSRRWSSPKNEEDFIVEGFKFELPNFTGEGKGENSYQF